VPCCVRARGPANCLTLQPILPCPRAEEYHAVLRAGEDLVDHYLWLKARHRDIKVVKVGAERWPYGAVGWLVGCVFSWAEYQGLGWQENEVG